ncbi:hypothetical protein F5883DRAFT_595877 [Diaporthe sp. PMI_573]|nr:hypothetical protein F5883DRAFT_595877 [Diaporthaceae sp. PMI_573]
MPSPRGLSFLKSFYDRRRAQISLDEARLQRTMATNHPAPELPVPPFPQQAAVNPRGTSQEGTLPSTSISHSESTAPTTSESGSPRTSPPGLSASPRPSTMQRDIDLTIEDIHRDLKADPSTLGQFSNHVVSQETHTNLRFLKIPHLKQYNDLYPEVVCQLTERGDHPGEKRYVAVSYCWESFTSLGSNVDERSPTVLVRQRGKPPRAPQCPAKVLMRAIAFAVSEGASLIWIDQECVNQEDPADVQNHLQCNHIIFQQAKFSLGLLSFQLSRSQVGSLQSLELYHSMFGPTRADFRRRALAEYGLKSILREIQCATRLLRAIQRDRWFTRAWVYQERHSANMDMHLLVPLSTEGLKTFRSEFGKELVGEDYPLFVGSICSIAATVGLYLSEPELGQVLQEDISVRDSAYESLNSLHEAAQLLSGPIFSGTSFDRVFEYFESRYLGTDQGEEIDNIRNLHLHQIFLELERCDSRVVSDRVAILSNIMNFQQRVITTSVKSYSWAVLMLLCANDYIPSVLIREETPTQSDDFLRYSVPASGLIMLAYQMKESIAAGRLELQKELENISCALTNFFGKDITRHTNFQDAVEDAVEGGPGASHMDRLWRLSKIKMPNLKRVVVIPLSETIGDIIGGIVSVDHVDNIGLQSSHGEYVVRYGRDTNQLKEGVTFMAFVGGYRWRSKFIDENSTKQRTRM